MVWHTDRLFRQPRDLEALIDEYWQAANQAMGPTSSDDLAVVADVIVRSHTRQTRLPNPYTGRLRPIHRQLVATAPGRHPQIESGADQVLCSLP